MRAILTIILFLGLTGCSSLPAELSGTWVLDVERTVELGGLGSVLTDKGRNAWSKELEETTMNVTYEFTGSDYTVQGKRTQIEGTVTQLREKEGRYTLQLDQDGDVERVRVWFDGDEMLMEQHHQTLVFKRK